MKTRVKGGLAIAGLAVLALAGCGSAQGSTAPRPSAVPSASSQNGYGVPTSGISQLKLSCHLTAPNGIPLYESTLTNPTPYAIQVGGWDVTLYNRNGTSVTTSPGLGGFEVDGDNSDSFDKMVPPDLTYSDANEPGMQTVVTGCQITKIW